MKTRRKKAAAVYWSGAIGQMGIVCLAAAFLRENNIVYPKFLDLLFLIIGGGSSAIWGLIVSMRFGHKSGLQLLKDFFGIRQKPRYYGMVVLFLLLIFGPALFRGNLLPGVKWYSFFVFFGQAIVFGGIEEIGWRYTWQPMIEQKISFAPACVCTFLSWGLWHYLYFYLVDCLKSINHLSFLIGLLGSCFIMGAVYRITHSLWLCVFYHCMLNVFSQTLSADSIILVIACNTICILGAIELVRVHTKQRTILQRNHS